MVHIGGAQRVQALFLTEHAGGGGGQGSFQRGGGWGVDPATPRVVLRS